MDLKILVEWSKSQQNPKILRDKIRKESDLNICLNLLKEIQKRAEMAMEAEKKNKRYLIDITEYLKTLEKRGILFDISKEDENESSASHQAKNPQRQTFKS